MNLVVAQRACLEESVLIMEARSSWRRAEGRLCVALQAEQIYIAHLQHVRVGPAMGNVT